MKHTKEELLEEILKCDAMQAQWRSKSIKLCNKYIEKYSFFKNDDKVEIIDRDGKKEFGKVNGIYFDSYRLFSYAISIWKKDFSNPKERRNHIWINKNNSFNIIKKVTE